MSEVRKHRQLPRARALDPGYPRDHSGPVTALEVIEHARKYLGVPYRHQGRTKAGLDCVGLVIAIGTDLQLLPAQFIANNYGRLPMEELVQKTAEYCTRIPQPEAGCMVLIRWPNEKRPGHSAILAGETMIHSFQVSEKVIEHGYRKHWVKWSESFWRLPGVHYG